MCCTVVTSPTLFSFRERECVCQYGDIKFYRVEFEDHILLFINRCMTDMHEYICMGKGIECEIAGTVTRIATYDHLKTGSPELSGILRCPSFQPGGELEGHLPCPPAVLTF